MLAHSASPPLVRATHATQFASRLRAKLLSNRRILRLIERFRNQLISFSSGELRSKLLRSTGMRIGKNCSINTRYFSTEPFLIEIGDHVAIASGTLLVTHDGSAWVLRERIPELDVFGEIKIGDNTFIGSNCIILPGTRIGRNCVVGAGSVVRGTIPDNSVVMGNPAKVIFNTRMLEALFLNNRHALRTKKMGAQEKKDFLLHHFKLKS